MATTLRAQTSLQGRPRPLVYGQARFAGNVIDYQGFKATPQGSKGSGSKGGLGGASGKGQTGQYNYSASIIVSLGETINSVLTIYNGNAVDCIVTPPDNILTDYATLGIVPSFGNPYGASFYAGTTSQVADGGWAAQYPAHSLAYRGESYVLFPSLALGSTPSAPNFNFECLGVINSDIPALGPDANPADVILDILTNSTYGVSGFPSNAIGDFSTARNYWRATGLMISDALVSGVSAQSYLDELMKALNADFRWTGATLDIVPYGDSVVVGNGYTFTPNLTPIYSLGVDDFLPNQGSLGTSNGTIAVAFDVAPSNTVYNVVKLEYLDRATLYNPVTVTCVDEASITATGRRRESDLRQHHFFALGSAASMSVALQGAREGAEAVQYQITVGRQFVLLDPMDLIAITEPSLQLVNQLVRITEIQENADQTLTLTLVEVSGTASAPIYARQASLGAGRNDNAPAPSVNTPIFFEPPDQLGDGLVIWIGLSGQIPASWGGCQVYMSSDGVSYAELGVFEGSSRMGFLTSSIGFVSAASSGVTIDTTNTPGVTLLESNGALSSGSPADVQAFNTAFVVDSEVMAYQTATLTGANAYTLGTLARGGYGSAISSHAAGAAFLRLDGSFYRATFDASRIGKPLYFKFLSFNPVGGGGQAISDVGAYPYTPTGVALSSALPSVTSLSSNFVDGFQQLSWPEISDFRSPILYEIRQGPTWGGALVIAVQAHPPFRAQGNGTFWLAARCTPITGLTVYSGTPISLTITGNLLSQNLILSYDEAASGWPGTLQSGLAISGSGSNAFIRIVSAANFLAAAAAVESLNPTVIAFPTGIITFAANVPASIQVGMAVTNATHPTSILSSALVAAINGKHITLTCPVVYPGVAGDTFIFSIADVLNAGGVITGTSEYYTSGQVVDLGYPAKASISANYVLVGSPVGQNILTVASILTMPDTLGAASTAYVSGGPEINIATNVNDAFSVADVFAAADAFQGPLVWNGWQKLIPGVQLARAVQHRISIATSDAGTIPYLEAYSHQVQLPARIDHYQNQAIPATGLTITFVSDNGNVGAFNGGPGGTPGSTGLPYVNFSGVGLLSGDQVHVTIESLSGLTVQIYNGGSPVARSGVNINVEGY